jgi:hypothetical protein
MDVTGAIKHQHKGKLPDSQAFGMTPSSLTNEFQCHKIKIDAHRM